MNKIIAIVIFNLCLSVPVFSQSQGEQLYKAISENDITRVRKLILDSVDVNYAISAGPFKMPMLHAAINLSKNKSIVMLLLENKADVNAKDAFNTTPLMYAASSGNKEIVELLLSYGADVNASDGQGNTVLSAAKEGKNKLIINLIEKKLRGGN